MKRTHFLFDTAATDNGGGEAETNTADTQAQPATTSDSPTAGADDTAGKDEGAE